MKKLTGNEYYEKYKANPYYVFHEGYYYDEVDLANMDSEDYQSIMEDGLVCDDEKNIIFE